MTAKMEKLRPGLEIGRYQESCGEGIEEGFKFYICPRTKPGCLPRSTGLGERYTRNPRREC